MWKKHESHWNHVSNCHGFGTSAIEAQTSRKTNPRSFPDAMSSCEVAMNTGKSHGLFGWWNKTKVSLGSSKLVETSFGSWMLMVICWWGVDLMLYHVDDIDVFKFENASRQALVGHQMGWRVPYWREKECVSGWKVSRKWQEYREYNGQRETKIIQNNHHLVNKSTSSTPHQLQKSTHQCQLWLSPPHPALNITDKHGSFKAAKVWDTGSGAAFGFNTGRL